MNEEELTTHKSKKGDRIMKRSEKVRQIGYENKWKSKTKWKQKKVKKISKKI